MSTAANVPRSSGHTDDRKIKIADTNRAAAIMFLVVAKVNSHKDLGI